MPRRGPRLKVIRRLGTPLPGLTRKDVGENSYPPGAHGPTGQRRKKSDYRRRLEEKQKLRFHYGVSESQLRKYFGRAATSPGVTGEQLLAQLERRLDNVVFRLGIAPTIPAARQLVVHGHVRVNGRRVDRPAFQVEVSDEVSISDKARNMVRVAEAVQRGPEVRLPGFLALDPNDPYVGRVISEPGREDIPFIVDEAAIVEFYAR
jgi:small subunit ribosomal protein S4